jgi:hypothetical protein
VEVLLPRRSLVARQVPLLLLAPRESAARRLHCHQQLRLQRLAKAPSRARHPHPLLQVAQLSLTQQLPALQ